MLLKIKNMDDSRRNSEIRFKKSPRVVRILPMTLQDDTWMSSMSAMLTFVTLKERSIRYSGRNDRHLSEKGNTVSGLMPTMGLKTYFISGIRNQHLPKVLRILQNVIFSMIGGEIFSIHGELSYQLHLIYSLKLAAI